MIHINITVQNPWHNNRGWRDLYQGHVALSKNKTLELCIDYYTESWFEFDLNTRWRGYDHAGPNLVVRVFGLGFDLSLPDCRHWDYQNNTWINA